MSERRIVVVEDESLVAVDLKECLQGFGYDVPTICNTGELAMREVEQIRPDLVLMDIMLAGEISGIEAAARIRDRLDIPVVFLTAHADTATFERAKVTEPYGYVLKPFKEMELRMVIELALHKFESERKRQNGDTAGSDAATRQSTEEILEQLESVTAAESRDAQRIVSILSKVECFSRLETDVLQKFATKCKFEDFRGGDLLLCEGDTNCAGFIPVFGRIAMVKASTSGKELIVELMAPLDAFGLLPAIETGPLPLSAKAQIDTRIVWVPNLIVKYVFQRFPMLSQQFTQKVLERLRKAHDLSRALAHDLVEVRIASSLLAIVARFCAPDIATEPYEVEITRQEIADLAGTTPETVSRIMKGMERESLLDLSQVGLVRVLNYGGLRQVARFS